MQSDFNKHLGSKLRIRRLSLGLTQTKVAKAINVTFQQIQKYEKGTNGVSSMRLYQLSRGAHPLFVCDTITIRTNKHLQQEEHNMQHDTLT